MDAVARLPLRDRAVADLLTGPGRNPSEAEALLEWMKKNEDAWRA